MHAVAIIVAHDRHFPALIRITGYLKRIWAITEVDHSEGDIRIGAGQCACPCRVRIHCRARNLPDGHLRVGFDAHRFARFAVIDRRGGNAQNRPGRQPNRSREARGNAENRNQQH